jgi:hypothetical protein
VPILSRSLVWIANDGYVVEVKVKTVVSIADPSELRHVKMKDPHVPMLYENVFIEATG